MFLILLCVAYFFLCTEIGSSAMTALIGETVDLIIYFPIYITLGLVFYSLFNSLTG